jgi:hypothetical protein
MGYGIPPTYIPMTYDLLRRYALCSMPLVSFAFFVVYLTLIVCAYVAKKRDHQNCRRSHFH